MLRNLSPQHLFLSLPTIITQVPALIILHFTVKITCYLVSSPSLFSLSSSLLHSPYRRIFHQHCSGYVSVLCADLQRLPNSKHLTLTSTVHLDLPQPGCNNSYNSLHTLNYCLNISIDCFLNISWTFSFPQLSSCSYNCFYSQAHF